MREEYSPCNEGSYRSQDGPCRSPSQWDDYCSKSGCRTPDDYVDFDRQLGMCVCKVEFAIGELHQQCV